MENATVRFGERDGHQIFLEPEGLDDDTVYPNGISTSLPEEVQRAVVASIPGLEKAESSGPAMPSNTTMSIRASCGRRWKPAVCGALSWPDRSTAPPAMKRPRHRGCWPVSMRRAQAGGGGAITFDRSQAYLGVMIDDLVTRGVTEPYRMFTSRAEYRLTLRADNADQRLTDQGHRHRLCRPERAAAIGQRWRRWTRRWRYARSRCRSRRTRPKNTAWRSIATASGARRSSCCRTRHRLPTSRESGRAWPIRSPKIAEQLEIDAKYAVYLERQTADIAAFRRDESLELPDDLDYAAVTGLSNEARQKLQRCGPRTIGQAGRIDGMTPAALMLLVAHLRRGAPAQARDRR